MKTSEKPFFLLSVSMNEIALISISESILDFPDFFSVLHLFLFCADASVSSGFKIAFSFLNINAS